MESAIENGPQFCQYLKTSITSNAKSKSERIPVLNKCCEQINEFEDKEKDKYDPILESIEVSKKILTNKLPPLPDQRKNPSVVVLQNAPLDVGNHSKTLKQ